jgi:hypothetical protein
MADIPFSVGGTTLPCPKFSVEPGALAYAYQNGSQVFIGAPSVTCTWPFLRDDYAAVLWAVYNTAVNASGSELIADTSIAVTVPDFVNGGLRTVQAYPSRPTGKAVGDGTQNMQVTFYNLHATSMVTAYLSPEKNYCDEIDRHQTVVVGANEYENNDWQF